jgi:hypothetical protein
MLHSSGYDTKTTSDVSSCAISSIALEIYDFAGALRWLSCPAG